MRTARMGSARCHPLLGRCYVDHPSFGPAVIARTLEAHGYKVAIVPQPDWHGDFRDFKKLGRPRLFFGVSPGAMDSMVNRYTANRRMRSRMLSVQTHVTTCAPTILLSSTHRFSRNSIPMFLYHWVALKLHAPHQSL